MKFKGKFQMLWLELKANESQKGNFMKTSEQVTEGEHHKLCSDEWSSCVEWGGMAKDQILCDLSLW